MVERMAPFLCLYDCLRNSTRTYECSYSDDTQQESILIILLVRAYIYGQRLE